MLFDLLEYCAEAVAPNLHVCVAVGGLVDVWVGDDEEDL